MDEVASRFETIPAVLGPAEVAEAAAQAWTERRGGSWAPGMRQRIYRLDTVIPAAPVSGSARMARPDDVELVVAWTRGFAADTDPQFLVPEEQARGWIDQGGVFLWDDGGAVSMARAVGGAYQGIRVGFVYTPPELRGRGYATALVAEVSRIVLEMGYAFCVLYTDLSNPTSNGIYQKIGYVPLVDVVDADIHRRGI
jgi:predicted GNAT family acetyltransferase